MWRIHFSLKLMLSVVRRLSWELFLLIDDFVGIGILLSACYRSMRPNIFLSFGEDSAQHRRWYYEVVVDHLESFLTPEPTHLRVGWACTEGYRPRPSGGEGWGGNGVGDDLCSYGFDGLHLWSGTDDVRTSFWQSSEMWCFEDG